LTQLFRQKHTSTIAAFNPAARITAKQMPNVRSRSLLMSVRALLKSHDWFEAIDFKAT